MPRKKTSETVERTEYSVDAKEFIAVWQTSATADEAARRLNMPKDIAHARASGYRRKGIKLKNMPREGKKKGLDVDALNKMIRRIEEEMARPGSKIRRSSDPKSIIRVAGEESDAV